MESEMGGCYIMDYRLTHHGEPNNSDQLRPILILVCSVPWFKDYVNYEHIPSLIMTPEDMQKVPQQYQARFKQPGKLDLYINTKPGTVNTTNISRNAPRHCGSCVRFKNCHGKI